jgi:hypothetical protein
LEAGGRAACRSCASCRELAPSFRPCPALLPRQATQWQWHASFPAYPAYPAYLHLPSTCFECFLLPSRPLLLAASAVLHSPVACVACVACVAWVSCRILLPSGLVLCAWCRQALQALGVRLVRACAHPHHLSVLTLHAQLPFPRPYAAYAQGMQMSVSRLCTLHVWHMTHTVRCPSRALTCITCLNMPPTQARTGQRKRMPPRPQGAHQERATRHTVSLDAASCAHGWADTWSKQPHAHITWSKHPAGRTRSWSP